MKKADSRKARGSITLLMKTMLRESPGLKYSTAKKAVGGMSKAFDERHFAWYKCAYKRGALKGVR